MKALITVTMTAALLWATVSEAAFFLLPQAPVLPPIGHSRFCLRYPDDCKVHGIDFRRRNIALTPARVNELNIVNREINRDIIPELTFGTDATEEWLILPLGGDCKNYAVTKRHELLARGWPSRALLLSEVVVPSGEHHLLLVVRTKEADLVLDNRHADIRPVVDDHEYRWVRIESPQNPKFWATVRLTIAAPADLASINTAHAKAMRPLVSGLQIAGNRQTLARPNVGNSAAPTNNNNKEQKS
jgi:predicted transglutaminase-like cysteine proteinase